MLRGVLLLRTRLGINIRDKVRSSWKSNPAPTIPMQFF